MFTAAMAATLCFFIACNTPTGQGGNDAAAQKNLAAAHAINDAIQSGDVSKLNDVIAKDAVDHAGPMGEIKSGDSIIAMLGKIHTMATDMKMETIKELADTVYVFQWMRFTGTSASPEMGPIGVKFDMTAIEVSKFSNGKLTEHWEFMQPADIMKMMNSQPPNMNNMDMKKDSAMKK